jgi:hypothetical protein
VFDAAYFRGIFAERVRGFSHDHEDARVRVEVVTPNGERHDALQLRAAAAGGTILTRDARLVFIPYARIAYVEVTILHDRRIPEFQLIVDA